MSEHNTSIIKEILPRKQTKYNPFWQKLPFIGIKPFLFIACNNVHFLVNSLYGSRIYAIYEKVHREFTQFPGTPLVVS